MLSKTVKRNPFTKLFVCFISISILANLHFHALKNVSKNYILRMKRLKRKFHT